MAEPPVTCPQCHAELEPAAKFCGACGRSVTPQPSAAGTVQAEAAPAAIPGEDESDSIDSDGLNSADEHTEPDSAADEQSLASELDTETESETESETETEAEHVASLLRDAAADADPERLVAETLVVPTSDAPEAGAEAETNDGEEPAPWPKPTLEMDVNRQPTAVVNLEAVSEAAAAPSTDLAITAVGEKSPAAEPEPEPESDDEPEPERSPAPDTEMMEPLVFAPNGLRGTQLGVGTDRGDPEPEAPDSDESEERAEEPAEAPSKEASSEPYATPEAPPPGATAPTAPPVVPPKSFAKTMMGFDHMATQKRAPAAAASGPPERAPRPLARTMLGYTSESPPAAKPAASPSAGAAPQRDPALGPAFPIDRPASGGAGGQAGPRHPMARTMLGFAPDASTPVAPPSAKPGGISQGTLLGLPAAPERNAGAPAPDDSGRPATTDRAGMARTMLGMAPLGSASSADSAPPSAAPGPAGVPAGRTMLGVAGPGAQSKAAAAGEAAAPRAQSRAAAGSERVVKERPRSRRDSRILLPLVAATLVVVAATLFLLFRSAGESASEVSAKIVTSEAGEALLLEVPSAPAGAKIRFGGQERTLSAGRASFALAADSLRVGDNLVLADVVHPDGTTTPVRITLAVFYRIWVDTAGLRADRPALDVIVTALPGTKVTLDAEALKLDEEGRGVRTYPVDVVSEAKSGVIEHVVRYRMQPPSGETVVDELRTRIPVAMMQIDRPGREVITDRATIEIAGAVSKEAKVAIDGKNVPVQDGRFLYRFALPAPGDFKPRVVASAAGKVPLGITLNIKRVEDLNEAAGDFAADPALNYAKLAGNPAIYRGQKIAIEGRVYAVDPRGAESVIQMFVRPCPKSRRCPIWVSDPHANDVAVDSWLRVLGVGQGEQQFRSEKNEIVTVPKVEAQFVLPAKP